MARAMELCAPQWYVVSKPSNGLGLSKRLVPPNFVNVTNSDQVRNWVQWWSERAGSERMVEVRPVGSQTPSWVYRGGVQVG